MHSWKGSESGVRDSYAERGAYGLHVGGEQIFGHEADAYGHVQL